MSSPTSAQKPIQSRPRRARLVLRDGAVVECGVFLNDGQALAPYLGSRKGGWVNVVEAVWIGVDEKHNHSVLQADHILVAASIDSDFPIQVVTAGTSPRDVDITLEDGSVVHGALLLAEKQRLSDFLTSCGKFLPVVDATRVPGNDPPSDLALNCGAVRVIHDTKVFAPGSMDILSDAAVDASPGGRPSVAVPAARPSVAVPAPGAAMPVNREVVRRESGEIKVVTESRVPDRRIGRPYTPPAPPAPAPAEPLKPPTDAQLRIAEELKRHWLVALAARAGLLPPDPANLSASPSLEEIWHGVAARNEMADGELAVRVAVASKLPVANLDQASPEALKAIPEKVARKLSVLPLRTDGRRLVLAISDPTSMEIEQHVGFVTRLHLDFEIAQPADIRGAIDWYYGGEAQPPA